VNTPISWQGANYRPIVLVSKDDDSVGAPVNGSTGNPGINFYAASALTIGVTNSVTLQNLRVANAQTAISLSGGSGHVIRNAQLVACQKGIAATSAEFSLRNALLYNVLTNFTGSSSTGRVEHLTVDTANWLNKDIGTNLFLTNCLLVAVTSTGTYSVPYDSDGDGIPDYIEARTNNTCGCVAPTITLLTPTNTQFFAQSPTNIVLTSLPIDSDGTILKVDYYNGLTMIGTANSGSDNYLFAWTNIGAGNYTFKAVATDIQSLTGTSAVSSNTVNGVPAVQICSTRPTTRFSSAHCRLY